VKFLVPKVIPMSIFILACCRYASAQTTVSLVEGKFEFTAFGGASFAGNFHFPTLVFTNGQVTSQVEGMHYASGYQVGFRVAENLSERWAVHLEYSFANQPLRFTNLSPTVQSLSLGHYLHHVSYDGTYLVLPPEKRFRPYVNAGAGTALFYITGHSKEEARSLGVPLRDSWEFAFNWGAGVKSRVEDQVVLTFEVKDTVTGVPSYGLPSSVQVRNGQVIPGISRNGFLNNWQLNFGIAVQWDE
jgi:opacity protein-like surface antigen